MNSIELITAIRGGSADAMLTRLYGADALDAQKARYVTAVEAFGELYGTDRDLGIYSVAGRSELSGNHTDHNHGCVIAASVDLDIIAVAAKREDSVIRVKSEGFPEDVVDIAAYTEPDTSKYATSASIIAGMSRAFADKPYADAMYLSKFSVAPGVMKGGVGSACIRYLEQLSKEQGKAKVRLDVYDRSEHAIKFYIKMGYETVGTAPDVLCMEKTL